MFVPVNFESSFNRHAALLGEMSHTFALKVPGARGKNDASVGEGVGTSGVTGVCAAREDACHSSNGDGNRHRSRYTRVIEHDFL